MNVFTRNGQAMPNEIPLHLYRKIPIVSLVLPMIPLMCLCAVLQVSAQRAEPASTATEDVQPLKIGDAIPDEVWNMPLQAVNHPDGKETITLADYKDKLIILDFWATWCVPCIRSLDKLDTMQQQLETKLAVVPATYEDANRAGTFVSKKNWLLPTVVSETSLKQYFPHRSVPHQVWLKENKVRAIVYGEDATIENFTKIWEDDTFTLHTKKDVLDYNSTSNIIAYAESTGTPVLSTSAITQRIEGIPSSTGIRKSNGKTFVNYTNTNLLRIYTHALGTRNNQIIIQGNNINKAENIQSEKRNTYCYQLIVQDNTDEYKIRQRTLSDLNSHFNVRLDSQVMDLDCYIISNSQYTTNLKSQPHRDSSDDRKAEQEFSSLISLLNFSIEWTPNQSIFIDESGYIGKMDAEPYDILQKDVEKLKTTLLPYGLTVKKGRRPVKMYILSDATEI